MVRLSRMGEELSSELTRDLESGLTSDQMRGKYQARLTARMIFIGLTEPEPQRAISAIRDLIDRVEGRATEKKKIHHRLEALTDQEVEAMLLTELDDLEADRRLSRNKRSP